MRTGEAGGNARYCAHLLVNWLFFKHAKLCRHCRRGAEVVYIVYEVIATDQGCGSGDVMIYPPKGMVAGML